MRSLRNLFAVGAVAALALAGCASGGDKAESTPESGDTAAPVASGDLVTLKVGASPSPHAKILQFVQDNLAAEQGLDIDIVEFSDYVQPNEALSSGDLDANFFQTVPYLESESESRGFDFVPGAGIHLEPLAVYSQKLESVDKLPEGGKIGIISDPANQSRGLVLLSQQGLLELPATGDVNVNTVKKLKNFEFVEVEGPQLVRSLADVDLAVINGNFAQDGGLSVSEDALVVESPENNPAVNILVWANGATNEADIKKLEELLHSDEVRQYIETEWTDGSVIPAF